MKEKIRVAVLMGGTSSEREISLRSGRMVIDALDREKYEVTIVDFTGDISPIVALKDKVDVILPTLHGPGGEDGRMQGLLDLLGIRYVGSGVLGSAVAMHKGIAKIIYQLAKIPTPGSITLCSDTTGYEQTTAILEQIGLPCVVKPASEGSSIGISIVCTKEALSEALEDAFRYDADVIVEEYVAGTEISVPVLGTDIPRAFPAVEIVPKNGFYDYEMKYTPGATDEFCPARISEAAGLKAAEYALQAHRALHCRGLSRTDMIVTGDEVTVLETNTLPGMTDVSLLPLSAFTAGLSFPELLDVMLTDVLSDRMELKQR